MNRLLKCVSESPTNQLVVGEKYEIIGEFRWFSVDYYQVKIDGRAILFLKDRFEENHNE